MDAEIKKKWVAALRSGDYKQGQGGLKQIVRMLHGLAEDEVQHCCLGVLQEVLGTPQWREEEQTAWFFGTQEDYHHGYLTDPVLAKVGLSDDDQRTLATKNDTGLSFNEIADYIETNL